MLTGHRFQLVSLLNRVNLLSKAIRWVSLVKIIVSSKTKGKMAWASVFYRYPESLGPVKLGLAESLFGSLEGRRKPASS